MTLKSPRKMVAPVAVLVAAAFLAAACGKKAPPRPPVPEAKLAAVDGLRKTVNGDRLRLSWSLASTETAAPDGFYVYRAKIRTAEPPCPGCPLLFERMAAIPWREAGTGNAPGQVYEYQEMLESGFRCIYKVAAYYAGGATGPDSEIVEVVR